MKCKNHSEEVAIERCSICGNWFCEDCVTVDNIKVSCNICLGQNVPNKEKTIIREVIEESGTIQKPKEETTEIFYNKPVPQEAQKNPEKIISNDEIVHGYNYIKPGASATGFNIEIVCKQQEEEFYNRLKALNKDNSIEFDSEVDNIMNQIINRQEALENYYKLKDSERIVLRALYWFIVFSTVFYNGYNALALICMVMFIIALFCVGINRAIR